MSATIAVAFTGASGLPYGMRLVECLIAAGVNVQLLYSPATQVVAQQELDREDADRDDFEALQPA